MSTGGWGAPYCEPPEPSPRLLRLLAVVLIIAAAAVFFLGCA